MKLLVTVLALTLGSLSCAGYGNRYGAQDEELVRSAVAGDDAPEWVSGMVQTLEGSIAFVGRGGGSNVLDERHAFDEALDHVRTQVANYIATRVVTSGSLHDQTDWEPGTSRFNRGYDDRGYDGYDDDGESQLAQHAAHQISRALVGGAAVSEQHWEQWDVFSGDTRYYNGYGRDNRFGSRTETTRYGTVRRYKCWVLSYISQEMMDTYIAKTLATIENESQVSQQQRDSALAKNSSLSASLATMQNDMRAEAYELQRLRERINYGRRFRLVGQEDCGHAAPGCDFETVHPDWRVISPVAIPSSTCNHVDSSCRICSITTNLH
jgi:hypothetical protein